MTPPPQKGGKDGYIDIGDHKFYSHTYACDSGAFHNDERQEEVA